MSRGLTLFKQQMPMNPAAIKDSLLNEILQLKSERDQMLSVKNQELQQEVTTLKNELAQLRSQSKWSYSLSLFLIDCAIAEAPTIDCKLLASPSLVKYAEEKYGTNQLIPFVHEGLKSVINTWEVLRWFLGKDLVAMLSKVNASSMVIVPVDINHLYTVTHAYPNSLTKICETCESLYKCLYRGYYYVSCKKKPNSRNYNCM